MKFRSVCVFCGSRAGVRGEYADAARAVGTLLAQRGATLVYGGGSIGLMGLVATAAMEAGGRVIGVIPDALAARELAHTGVTDLRVVPSMHARKALMADLSEAFIAMPGGYGTFEELFEIVTWAQLGLHTKPIGVLNVRGYYDALLAFVDHSAREGFIQADQRALFVAADTPPALLERMEHHEPPPAMRWVGPEET